MSSYPSVAVMLCSFNGSKYISEQINSILMQKSVQVTLFVHDDGSNDTTRFKLHEAQQKWGIKRIKLLFTDNMGYPNSFYWLLDKTPDEFDYYAFADQDDVWVDDKLSCAISMLNTIDSDNIPLLYGSSTTNVDEQLRPIKSYGRNYPYVNNVISFFMRVRIAAHTMVFNQALKDALSSFYPEVSDVGHDQLALLVASASGKVMIDNESHVLHRRDDTCLSGSGRGLKARIVSELKSLSGMPIDRVRLAQKLLDSFSETLDQDERYVLQLLSVMRKKTSARIKLAISPMLRCGIGIVRVKTIISLVINRY
ncbi:glycosyltransferase [Collinsella tanakaei]|uniref:glycosyltransferase n=1 Tax=Collinsella tanakaei TaxID=626935 RepID=UPI0025A35733|nr:glycosyltransferase [Collinsella tanakaei]MDM8246384.1 glycosyltransferase [Collinsella tanakaei]